MFFYKVFAMLIQIEMSFFQFYKLGGVNEF
jgi:hypothetical protein